MHESNEMSFGWCFIIYFVFWKTCASLDTVFLWILEREHFSADIRMVSVPGSDVSG